ncbi:hypothetical protein H012_gp696 [Acanthamoeba polyphaga moumouvirus]|uniref:Uncharacterized protein n=1 Tax=Acanthamoeba polyphaga moumouvirus TaxID=1269028 RepID=L7RBC9_9VIRU|nr:hypothetical protein H012_gp696 [Acanthamoeba polyphaga moumouvirus]AGC01769.1 hypothetical protein Moumou_00225 [Acanthamoeba polyphaga moumouvirus]AQN68118.1 hypothetical protein [Saudi moumouvirus]
MSNNKSIKKLYGVVLSNLQDNSYTAQKVSSMPSRIEKLPGCKISVYVHKYNKSSSKITVSKPVSKNKKNYNSKTSKINNTNKKRCRKSYRNNCSKRKRVKPKKRKSCNLKHRSKTLQSNRRKLQNVYEGYYFKK